MLTKMKGALNRSEISASTVLNSGRHKSIGVSALYQEEDDTDHLARNECIHFNPKKRSSDSAVHEGLGFLRPVQKQRASLGTVQNTSVAAPQVSVPMAPPLAMVPAAPASGLNNMMMMYPMMMMRQMMQMMGSNQQLTDAAANDGSDAATNVRSGGVYSSTADGGSSAAANDGYCAGWWYGSCTEQH